MILAGIPALFLRMDPQTSSRASTTIYPGPQNAPDVSAGRNVLGFPEGPRPKATDLSAGAQAGVSPWYGVYEEIVYFAEPVFANLRVAQWLSKAMFTPIRHLSAPGSTGSGP